MQYQLNYLMSAEEVCDFLVEHKSELKSLADAFGVGYSTLRNYVYGQTPLESMPYRLLKVVTEYNQVPDLLHPSNGLILPQNAFYSLARLSGHSFSTPKAFALEQYSKVMMVYFDRRECVLAGEPVSAFEPCYFFVDMAYQADFISYFRYETDVMVVEQMRQQLKDIYGIKDDFFDDLVRGNEGKLFVESSNEEMINQLVSLSLPKATDDVLYEMFVMSHNIHLILTNTDRSRARVTDDFMFMTSVYFDKMEYQSRYHFDGGRWYDGVRLLTVDDVAHLQEKSYAYQLPEDSLYAKAICHNMISRLEADKGDDLLWINMGLQYCHRWIDHVPSLSLPICFDEDLFKEMLAMDAFLLVFGQLGVGDIVYLNIENMTKEMIEDVNAKLGV